MKPAFPTREEFICAWIAMAKAEHGTEACEKFSWAHSMMSDFLFDRPELALGLVVEIWSRDQSRKVIQILSAGPLEDLLAIYGEEILPAIERDFTEWCG
jgi:hypothetical protein